MPTQAAETVEVPTSMAKTLRKFITEDGGISRRRLARTIRISEPTFYKIIGGEKGARISVQTFELVQKFIEKAKEKSPEEIAQEEKEKDANVGFMPKHEGSVIEKHFARREDAIRVLNSVDAILKSDMAAEEKVFAAQRVIGEDVL